MKPLLDGSAVGLLITGAALGLALGTFALVFGSTIKRWTGRGIPLAGLALAVPLLLVSTGGPGFTPLGYAGFGALVVAGIALRSDFPALVHGAAAIPGATLLAFDNGGPAAAVILLGVPIGVVALSRFDSAHDYEHGLAPMCAAIAGGGAFLTLPDTEHIAVIAGAGVAVGTLVFLVPRFAMGGSRGVWLGAFFWAVATDGVGRTSGLVGAIGVIGLLVIDPVVRTNISLHRGILTYLPASNERMQIIVVAIIQTTLALFIARLASLRTDVNSALLLTIGAWVFVGGLLGLYAQRRQANDAPVAPEPL